MAGIDVAVVGAGVFGVSAALELARRGRSVQLIAPGPWPHPDASSTDISKIVRLDYGADAFYCELMERALPRWRALNAQWERPLFHETGFVIMSSRPMREGSFEGDSFAMMQRRGHPVERLNAAAMRDRFAVLSSSRFVDGYYNPQGGWVESGAAVAALAEQARRAGALLREAEVRAVEVVAGRAQGVTLASGERIDADTVVVAAGAWTPALLDGLPIEDGRLAGDELTAADGQPAVEGRQSGLRGQLRVVGQPVMMFAPADPRPFRAPALVPWAADISASGWYGFCANGEDVVKVANHGRGTATTASAPRRLPAGSEARFRRFLADTFGALQDAPIVDTRLCLYCDSLDGDLLIARHPGIAQLVAAAGGSGHAFKLAPLLGELIADRVEQRDNPALARFGWRAPDGAWREKARAK